MHQSDRERRMLARTQLLMVVVSLIPLGVLFYISSQFVFEPLLDQGRDQVVYGVVAALVLTALIVVLGYILVRRDTIRTIAAIAEGEQRLDQLYQATGALAEIEEIGPLQEALLRVATELTAAERAGLWIREGDTLTLEQAIGMSLERGSGFPLPVGQGLVGTAASRARALLEEPLTDTDRSWDDRVHTATTSSLIVPLELGGEVIGVLDLRNRANGGKFTVVDQQLAEGLSRQAALFMRNAAFHRSEALFERGVGTMVKEVTEQHLCWPGHVDNVTAICDKLALRLTLPDEKRHALGLAALVHDIGLLDFPKADIGPPGGPVDHAVKGAERLAQMAFWEVAAPIVRAHHEQQDGQGPLGLRGFAIPMTSRVLALAEYVDTVTNPGSPWGTKSLQEVVDEISSQKDKRFDPTVVIAFVEDFMAASSGDMSIVSDDEGAAAMADDDPWATPGA